MENRNAKWGPWKMARKDASTYKPLIVEQYEREGQHDVGEFSDIPTWENRIVVIDENGSKHEFSGLQQQKESDDFIKQKIKELKKKKGNAMTNNLEAKKLAVIKSNAAPEVKLKALNKLNAIENSFLADYQKMIQAYQTGDKKTALEMAKKLAESGSKDAARMKDVQHVLKQLGEIGASDNAAPDDKLAGPKKALSALLSSLGYAQMSKDVLKETELEKLKPYGRAVLSDMQKQSNPAIKDKLPRVQELLSKLGVL